ncbi:MAG: ABC transporter permease/substrate-binding protein [Aureliella sp.]
MWNTQHAITVLCCLVFGSMPALSLTALAEGPTIRVGSKGFTESVILGEVIADLARSAGADVKHRAELGGTQILWKSLLAGDIDVYVDYTGTIREEILADAVREGAELKSDADMREALKQRGVLMSEHIGFNNTYALGMRRQLADELGIMKISDLVAHPELKFGLSDEFMERNDGWYKLAERYQLPQTRIRTMDHNMAYRGLVHDAIQVTDIYTTDAEIEFYDLRALEDDQSFFPTYYAVVLMRDDLPKRAPEAAQAIYKLEGLIDSREMSAMTAKVRLDRQSETTAARQFLNKKLGLELTLPSQSWQAQSGRVLQRLGKTTLEHLFLVLVSLGLAIVVAIPLGIVSSRYETLGHAVLAVVSVIQTLPSMALLVFMIPVFGLGAIPAIAALFFYSLLPIVRNTYAGICQIPVALRESAEVLGLEPRARLRLVEIPLALPSILSGIKTAAVINVGTATIGALIGAGGYGAPILTGIRLSSIPLILQGAVPAALMAIVVQFGFGLLEKQVVSPGLVAKS